jgi:hypothetical protein
LLNLLGLDNLGSGDSITLGLTNILSGLGLDTNVDLSTLSLSTVLTDFNLNPNVDMGLGTLLDNLGFGTLLSTGLGTELSNLGLLSGLVTDLNGVLGTLLSNSQIADLFTLLGLPAPGSLLTATNLEDALNGTVANPINVGDLLGGQTLNEALSNILTALGVEGAKVPGTVTIGDLLSSLGFASSTGDLTLGSLLSDLGNPFGLLNITDLLNGLNLGQLLGDFGLSNLPVDLTNLGDLSGLTLGGLLGDLGLGDLATVSVAPIGGLVTELVDTVPQQILTALGM